MIVGRVFGDLIDRQFIQRPKAGEKILQSRREVENVRRREQQTPAGTQHAMTFADEMKLVFKMLNPFHANDRVKTFVGERKLLVHVEEDALPAR